MQVLSTLSTLLQSASANVLKKQKTAVLTTSLMLSITTILFKDGSKSSQNTRIIRFTLPEKAMLVFMFPFWPGESWMETEQERLRIQSTLQDFWLEMGALIGTMILSQPRWTLHTIEHSTAKSSERKSLMTNATLRTWPSKLFLSLQFATSTWLKLTILLLTGTS